MVIDAVLSPAPCACAHCGSSVIDAHGQTIIVKNGKKKTIVRFEEYNHMPLIMRLKKQRYTCKTVCTIGQPKVTLSAQDIRLPIMSNGKITALLAEKCLYR